MLSFKEYLKETKNVYFRHPESGSRGYVIHDDDGGLLLTGVETPKRSRGKGGASNIVKQATDYADKHKKPIRLNAISTEDDSDPDKLINLYKKHGFKSREGKPKFSMIRHPVGSEQ